MSRRNASSAGAVSLFPFLAVLVCAMGALILLLLVTTRRIRQRSLAQEVIVAPVEEQAPTQPATPSPVSLPPMPTMAAATPQPVDLPILPLLAADPPPPMPRPFDPTPALLQRLAELETEQAALAADVAARRQQLAELERSTSEDQQKLTQLTAVKTSLDTEKERLSNLFVHLREQEAETQQRADALRQRIQNARAQAADADSKFAVVPYDGDSGTTRRPIIIECTADRFTFVSEGVSLGASDLNGFTPRYNPLLYVTHALIRYWERESLTSSENLGQPYLLLIVRPGGTTGYYVARGLLAGLDQPFGYELVTDDQTFAWPRSDLESVAICKTIINKMLKERDELMEHALHGGANLTDFSNDQGDFRLEEIDRLQKPVREVTINGQRFSRDPIPGNQRSGAEDLYGRHSSQGIGRKQSSATGSSDQDDTGGADFGNLDDFVTDGTGTGAGPVPETVHAFIPPSEEAAAPPSASVPDWLQEGASRLAPPARLAPPSRRSGTSDVTQIDPFADIDGDSETRPPTAGRNDQRTNGRSGTYDASASKSGDPANPPQSSDMMTFTPQGKRGERMVDPVRPQWGIRTAGGTIGYERDVRVDVSPTQVSIGERNGFQLDNSMPLNDVRRLLAAAIDREVRSWGPPPKSFYWVPSVHFVVATDGRANQDRLRNIVKSWELRSTVEYIKE